MAKADERSDFYLYLSSHDNKALFTENKASNFNCIIPDGISFEGKWECALVNIGYYPDEAGLQLSDPPRPVYLLCNFVKPSFTPVANAPILTRFYVSDNLWKSISKSIINPEYHDICVTSLNLVHLYISDSSFNLTHMPNGLLAVTVHFRKKEYM